MPKRRRRREQTATSLFPRDALSERVARERASHECGDVFNNSAAIHRRFNHVITNPNVAHGEQHFSKYLGQIAAGGLALEIGCGGGIDVLRKSPFKLIAIDISFRSLEHARNRYGNETLLFQMDAHRTGFREESFDAIVGRSILHHLDYDYALNEIHRILKVGGLAIFAEPLSGNPAARLWRALTPAARTADERPLSWRQVTRGDLLFTYHNHRFVNLMSTPLAMATSLTNAQSNNCLLRFADEIDRILERTPAKYWMRTAYLVWRK